MNVIVMAEMEAVTLRMIGLRKNQLMQYHHLWDSVEVVVLEEAVEVFEVAELLTEAMNSIVLKWDQLMPLTQNHHMSASETDLVD